MSPRTLRIGEDRAKGYETSDFTEAFERYLPAPGESKRDTVTTPANTGVKPTFGSVTPELPVTDSKVHGSPANIELSRCHVSIPRGGKTTALIPEDA